MKSPSFVSAKYGEQALSISSIMCVLLFAGCSSIDGTAENQKVAANLVTGHVEQAQEQSENQAVPELSYEWFY